MAIKLEVYLKRTHQSLEEWMSHNEVTRADELHPRARYLGFDVSRADIAAAEQIFKQRAPKPVEIKPPPVVKPAPAPVAVQPAPEPVKPKRPEQVEQPTETKKPRRKADDTTGE